MAAYNGETFVRDGSYWVGYSKQEAWKWEEAGFSVGPQSGDMVMRYPDGVHVVGKIGTAGATFVQEEAVVAVQGDRQGISISGR